MSIKISDKVKEKLLNKHGVQPFEVVQCFENITGGLLVDDHEDHRSDPPTMWFIARTNKRRLLKVCFIQDGADIYVKSCFEPIEIELRIYKAKAQPPPHDL